VYVVVLHLGRAGVVEGVVGEVRRSVAGDAVPDAAAPAAGVQGDEGAEGFGEEDFQALELRLSEGEGL